NSNYEETGLLVSLNQFADNTQYFLKNFYLKGKRSILKPNTEGPAAYVFSADDPRSGAQADLLRILQLQKVEISRATQPFTVTVPGPRRPARQTTTTDTPAERGDGDAAADAPAVLDAQVEAVKGEVKASGGVAGSGSVFAINHNTDPALITLRYRLKDAKFEIAEEPFEAGGQKFGRGSFIVQGVTADDLGKAASDLGIKVTALPAAPSVKTHPGRAPRIALVHTWINTQDEGWWRQTLDIRGVPFAYISTQALTNDADLQSKYDVILFPPVGRASAQQIITGTPMYGNPIPWKTTELTPNIGKEDSTDDIRPGMGWTGLMHLQKFVRDGGVLIAVDDTAEFAQQFGFTPGVSTTTSQRLKVVGSVLRSKMVDAASPIAYGYGDDLSIYADNPPIFSVS